MKIVIIILSLIISTKSFGQFASYNFNGNVNDQSTNSFNLSATTTSPIIYTDDGNGNPVGAISLPLGANPRLQLPYNATFDVSNVITIVARVRFNGFNGNFCNGNSIVSRGGGQWTGDHYSLTAGDNWGEFSTNPVTYFDASQACNAQNNNLCVVNGMTGDVSQNIADLATYYHTAVPNTYLTDGMYHCFIYEYVVATQTARLFIDGVLAQTNAGIILANAVSNGGIGTTFNIGWSGFGGGYDYDLIGDIDYVDLYSNAPIADINQNQFCKIIDTTDSNNCDGLCYWKVKGNNIIGGNNIFGTLTPDDIDIRTNNTSVGIIKSNGNFGIGSIVPLSKLQIENNNPDLHLNISGNAPSLKFDGDGTNNFKSKIGVASTLGDFVTSSQPNDLIIQNNTGENNILFGNGWNGGGIERMRIDRFGEVGINTINSLNSLPTALLHVNCIGNNGDDANALSDVRFENLETGKGTILVIDNNGYVRNSKLTIPNPGLLNNCLNNNFIPKVSSGGSSLDCSQIFDNGTSVGINSTSGFTYSSLGGTMLGTIVPSSTGTIKLQVNGSTRSLAYFATSDSKFKEKVNQLANARLIISQLKAKSYFWNNEAVSKFSADKGMHIGYLAQDLEKILPSLVITDENNDKAVNYLEIIPILSEALNEQDLIIENNNLEIQKLKDEVATINIELSKIINCCSKNNLELNKPTSFNYILQNTPNPFKGVTSIEYSISNFYKNAYISVLDLNGKELTKMEIKSIGKGKVIFDLSNFSAGIYLYSLILDNEEIQTKKMILSN
jgi:Secretion system C-terminal sorting domain/Chaperone of endosialidase